MKLTRQELILFLTLRSLSIDGDDSQLAFRLASYDLFHRTDLSAPRIPTHPPPPNASEAAPVTQPPPHPLPSLPPELWAEILEIIDDWQLATALGIRTNLSPPADWARDATSLDRAILSGSISYVRSFLSCHPTAKLTKHGAKAMVRFSYTDLLSLLLSERPAQFKAAFSERGCHIPALASRLGQTKVLSWWLQASDPAHSLISRDYDEEPLHEASRKGNIHVLEWWKTSGLPLRYDMVMNHASRCGQIEVLEWWKNSGLPLRYDKGALWWASFRGEVGVLEWWKRSGLSLIYDKEVLVEATKYNHVNVLDWWKHSGLKVHYILFEIEAALEDAIGGAQEAKDWWDAQGARFDVPVAEWTEDKVL
jgi:hypothetical protein